MISLVKNFFYDLYVSRSLIIDLTVRDFKSQNQGSYLGLLWSYLQPVFLLAVLYSVFTYGFRAAPVSQEVPFSIYLVSGMCCWLYLSSNLISITGVIRAYSFLVKKVDFRLSVLPIVKILSSLGPHLFLVLLSIVLASFHGVYPGLHTLQLIYYVFCVWVLLLGFGWLTSSTSVFIKDISNLVTIITQFGFWLTPIFWQIENMPERVEAVLKINPAYYLVTGYRDSIYGDSFFWQRPLQETVTFWFLALSLLFVGAVVFKKLKPHFAEVI